ncbi:MAG: hypothetical protein WCT85_00040 [Parachlamydiales bacterium]|jgi:hypothetical protein
MIKKFITATLIICFSLFSTQVYAQSEKSDRINAEASAASSYHATAISMVFWGVLIIAGIAVAAILIESSSSHSE